MIQIKRKWPPDVFGLPSRHVIISDDNGNDLTMIAQYGKSFIGRVHDFVVVVDDAKSYVHAAIMSVVESKICHVRILNHEGGLDDALRAAFEAIYGQHDSGRTDQTPA